MIPIPTLEELHGFAIAVAKAVLPTRDWTRRKPGWKFMRVVSMVATYVSAQLKSGLADLLPDTSEGSYLERWGNMFGVAKKGATPGRKAGALRVVGAASEPIPLGTTIVHRPSGLRFMINEATTIPAAPPLWIDVDVIAIDTGSQTLLEADEVLTFETPADVPGLEEDAVLILDIDEGGQDSEADGRYRVRILTRISTPPLGGAPRDYEQWSIEAAEEGEAENEIVSAYVYPIRAGLGTVDVAALKDGSGADRLLSSGERAVLQAKLDENKPANVRDVRVLIVEETLTDVEVTITTNGEAQYVFDWNDSTPLEITSWTALTRAIVFTTDRPDSMEAGGRLIIKTTAGTGEQFEIESLVSTDSVILVETPSVTPVATNLVYSGGALVDTVRDAIIEHIDSLGTSNPDVTVYGTWEGNLRPENLYRVTQAIVGVRKSTVVAPAATVEPADNAYPDDDTVFMVSPQRIIVRKAW